MDTFLKSLMKKFKTRNNTTGLEFAQHMLDIVEDGGSLTYKQLEWCKKNSKMHSIPLPNDKGHDDEDDKELCKSLNLPSISDANRRLKVLTHQTSFDAYDKNIEVQAVKLIGALDTALSEINHLREEMLNVLKEIEVNFPTK